jgi:hypothetical protein
LDKAIDVRGFPFELAVGMVGSANVGAEEELAGVFVGPVFRKCEFGFAFFDGFDEGFEGAVFAD